MIGARCKYRKVLSRGVLISDPIRKFINRSASWRIILPHEVVRISPTINYFESLNAEYIRRSPLMVSWGGSVWLEHPARYRKIGGSNPPPTTNSIGMIESVFEDLSKFGFLVSVICRRGHTRSHSEHGS